MSNLFHYRKDSFDNVSTWVSEIENNTDEDVLVYLVGNRVDIKESIEVTTEDGLNLMREKLFSNFFETSAKTGQNVKELFQAITKHLYLNNKDKLDRFVSHHHQSSLTHHHSFSFMNAYTLL